MKILRPLGISSVVLSAAVVAATLSCSENTIDGPYARESYASAPWTANGAQR